MNWTRTILDGLAMAAYFNLFAAAVALYRPRLMFPCYPPAILKAAKAPPQRQMCIRDRPDAGNAPRIDPETGL